MRALIESGCNLVPPRSISSARRGGSRRPLHDHALIALIQAQAADQSPCPSMRLPPIGHVHPRAALHDSSEFGELYCPGAFQKVHGNGSSQATSAAHFPLRLEWSVEPCCPGTSTQLSRNHRLGDVDSRWAWESARGAEPCTSAACTTALPSVPSTCRTSRSSLYHALLELMSNHTALRSNVASGVIGGSAVRLALLSNLWGCDRRLDVTQPSPCQRDCREHSASGKACPR